MLILKIVGASLCLAIACYSIRKFIECTLNLRALYLSKKEPELTLRNASIVYNKKIGKLEADNHQILPFN